MKKILLASTLVLLGGCAGTQFTTLPNDEYKISRMSDACAAGSPSSALEALRQEAVKFCAGRKESVVETSSSSEFGIPVVRCASATMTFRCATSESKPMK
jgi:hypothetical protein